MIGYDIDGVCTAGVELVDDCVIISGRTWVEYDATCRQLAQKFPVYIRGCGRFGDRVHAGKFKAQMISLLGVTEFHEDDKIQAEIIQKTNPDVLIVLHKLKP